MFKQLLKQAIDNNRPNEMKMVCVPNINNSHTWMKHSADTIYKASAVVCTSSIEVVRINQQLIDDEIRYVNQLASIKSIHQYMKLRHNPNHRVKMAIHQRLDALNASN